MLTRANRLTSSRAFGPAIRRGRRSGTRTVVLHLWLDKTPQVPADAPRVGFVVSKAVGPAVVRNAVKRRLRHLVRDRLPSLPGAAVLVVRALPGSATASYAQLGSDLDRCLDRCLDRRVS